MEVRPGWNGKQNRWCDELRGFARGESERRVGFPVSAVFDLCLFPECAQFKNREIWMSLQPQVTGKSENSAVATSERDLANTIRLH